MKTNNKNDKFFEKVFKGMPQDIKDILVRHPRLSGILKTVYMLGWGDCGLLVSGEIQTKLLELQTYTDEIE